MTVPVSGLTRRHVALALAILIVLALASYNNLHRSIWIDEAYSFDTARRSLGSTLHQALHFELQPPAYFLALNLWLRAHPTIEFGRFFSTLCVLATLGVLFRFPLSQAPDASRASLPLFAALSPPVLWAASEARGYALTLFLTTVATLLFIRILTGTEAPSRRLLVLYVVVWLLALLTFYYSGFLLAAQLVAALFTRTRARPVLICVLVIGALLLPWVPTILRQAAQHPVSQPLPVADGGVLARGTTVVREALAYVREALLRSPVSRRPLLLTTLVAGILVLLNPAFRRSRAARDPLPLALAVCTLMPLAALLLLRFSNLAHSTPRYLIFVLPSAIAWLGLGIDRLANEKLGWSAALGWTAILGASMVSFQRNSSSSEDWRGASTLVRTRETVGQPIFIYPPDALLPFRYYYRGPNRLLGLPHDPDLERYTLERPSLSSEDEVRARLQLSGADRGEFWLLLRERRNPGIQPDIARLDEFFGANAVLLEHDSLCRDRRLSISPSRIVPLTRSRFDGDSWPADRLQCELAGREMSNRIAIRVSPSLG